MTDYELAYLINEMGANITDIFSVYISILFAFLVSSYLVAQRLSTGMVVVAVGTFTFYAFYNLVRTMAITAGFNSVTLRAIEAGTVPGNDIHWHPASTIGAISPFSNILGWFMLIMLIVTYVGAIYFFYACRKGQFRVVE